MARSLWTGAISFGLVNVPVRLYSATSAKDLHFHMLHGKDGGRIKQKRVCSVDGEEVPFEEIVKGYELTRGQYVRIDPDELAKFHPKATHAIEIEDFVKLSEIDPIYFESTYHVAPDQGAGRAFSLLRLAMEQTKKVAIARMVMRTKQYLCAVRPAGSRMLLSTMLYADEVVGADDLDLPAETAEPRGRELEMAEKLIESLTAKWKPDKYRDEYREQVLELIHKKAEGEELVAPPEAAPAKVVNLADALAASLAARGKAAPEKAEKNHAKAPVKASRRAPAEHPVAAKRATTKRRKSS